MPIDKIKAMVNRVKEKRQQVLASMASAAVNQLIASSTETGSPTEPDESTNSAQVNTL